MCGPGSPVGLPGKERVKAYKSLEAYDYFVSRKVGAVSSFKGEPSPSGLS